MKEPYIGDLTAENLNKLTYSEGGWLSLSDASWARGGYDDMAAVFMLT